MRPSINRSAGTDGLDRWRICRANNPDVPHRRLTKETAVLAVELARTLIPDFERGACSVETIHKHSSTGGLQPNLLLVLKRT